MTAPVATIGPDVEGTYRTHRTVVLSYFRSRLYDHHTAEDLAQDVWVRAITSLHRFVDRDTGAGIRGWLLAIAHNRWVDHLKNRHTQRTRCGDPWELDELDEWADPAIVVERAHLAAGVQRVLTQLTPDQRRAVALRYLDQLDLDETAGRLGRDTTIVKALTYRATQTLRRTGAATQWR